MDWRIKFSIKLHFFNKIFVETISIFIALSEKFSTNITFVHLSNYSILRLSKRLRNGPDMCDEVDTLSFQNTLIIGSSMAVAYTIVSIVISYVNKRMLLGKQKHNI